MDETALITELIHSAPGGLLAVMIGYAVHLHGKLKNMDKRLTDLEKK